MSYTTSIIYEDFYCECPCCGEMVTLSDEEIELFEKSESVPVECFDCGTIFYLEDDD